MDDVRRLLEQTATLAADYLESLERRPVFPQVTPEQLREALGGSLPADGIDPGEVVTQLAEAGDAGAIAMGSGRYFGFVIGGALPAALAADWLTSAWDQNAGLYAGGPAASVVEEVAREWVTDLLGLPADATIGFVTGTQMAHVTGLAAARLHVLERAGWDVGREGLHGGPRVRVLVGAKRHVTVDRALRLLGLGAPTVVEADDQGRMRVDALRAELASGGAPTIVSPRPARSTPARSTTSTRLRARRATRARGSTSTAPSGSGRPSRRRSRTSSRVSSARTRGRPTHTSG